MRGCGNRKPGGVYICSKLGPYGKPLEHFIIDPPLPFDGKPFRAPIVMKEGDTKHLVFWVGAEFYPECCDYIEETRVKGASKRVRPDFPIEILTPESKMFFVHPRAIIENFTELPKPEYCPKQETQHTDNAEYCIGHTYQLPAATPRSVGDVSYTVYPAGVEASKLTFKAGTFMWLPINAVEHVLNKDGTANKNVMEKKHISKIPLYYVKE